MGENLPLIGEFLQNQKEQTMNLKAMRQTLIELKADLRRSSLLKKEVLTLSEASELTGLSTSELYKKTSTRAIPFYKPAGKLIYFRRAELEAWLTNTREATLQEIEEHANRFCINSKN